MHCFWAVLTSTGKFELMMIFTSRRTIHAVVEPPEASPDPEVPTSGPQFSSDVAADGPVQ